MMRVVTVAGYVAFVVLAVGLEITARMTRRVPTFGEILAVLLRRTSVRLLLQVGWLWVGWHVFVRVDWR